MNQFLRQLPRYRCHKEVSALKIADIVPNPRGYELHFEDQRFAPHQVSEEWVGRHLPSPGGYFVVYEDGYQSWSPAQAFESGYHLIEDADGAVPSMDFGEALRALKAGRRVARAGWNGKGMWLSLSGPLHGRSIAFENFWSSNNSEYARENGGSATVLPCITMKTATGEILMGWLASQTDMLASDWCVVE